MGEHAEWSKYSNYEVSTRVPLIIHLPDDGQFQFEFINVLKPYNLKSITPKKVSNEFVELVDIFPTLVDAADLEPLKPCILGCIEEICTEGLSLLRRQAVRKIGVFSQYPRPSIYPKIDSDQPKLRDIKIMGYSVRTEKYRYTEWIGFNPFILKSDWNKIYGRELYIHSNYDDSEDNNVIDEEKERTIVIKLSNLLKCGYMCAIHLH